MGLHRLQGKIVLVTGAAAGIGRATALRLASEGARLALADRNVEGLKETAAELGADAPLIEYDAMDAASSMTVVDLTLEAYGRIDGVCNIAGVFSKGHLDKIGADDWERILRINLTSVFHIAQRAVPALIETKGSIVNTSSIAGLDGLAYAAAYAVAKAGVISLTKTMAIEFSGVGVRANVVCPGGVRTAMGGSAPLPDADPALAIRRSRLPGLDGLGEPSDLAAAYAYLLSDDARYVSGSVLVVDGAQHLI
jgi:NAD(P)-dependent dehydrogenase (short-subunit alcohol dehydrogenase family)